MDGLLILKVVTIILGLAILIGGIFYRKKGHEGFSEGASSGVYSGSFLAYIIVLIFGFLLSIGPWWLAKTVIIFVGLILLYVSIFYL